jgi:hypothetical protein
MIPVFSNFRRKRLRRRSREGPEAMKTMPWQGGASMAIDISLVELQLHVAEALAPHGIGVEAFQVLPDRDGGWRISLENPDSGVHRDCHPIIRRIEIALGQQFRVHRLSRGGAYGG